jgi:hypothetical protein
VNTTNFTLKSDKAGSTSVPYKTGTIVDLNSNYKVIAPDDTSFTVNGKATDVAIIKTAQSGIDGNDNVNPQSYVQWTINIDPYGSYNSAIIYYYSYTQTLGGPVIKKTSPFCGEINKPAKYTGRQIIDSLEGKYWPPESNGKNKAIVGEPSFLRSWGSNVDYGIADFVTGTIVPVDLTKSNPTTQQLL